MMGVAGVVGGVLTGFFATDKVVPATNGVFYASAGSTQGARQLGVQLMGICFTVGWSAVVSFLILKAISLAMGLRVTDEQEMV